MLLQAHTATIACVDSDAPQFSIDLFDTGIVDDVHAQPRRQLAIFIVRDEMQRTLGEV